ncbi:hypothetical protein BGZ60DRAFT_566001 [Tricladium varicosporioides]|nr:hypothetical protein BGZ60DRAFT_566001 [Hymenoscyphus varicosporioides]
MPQERPIQRITASHTFVNCVQPRWGTDNLSSYMRCAEYSQQSRQPSHYHSDGERKLGTGRAQATATMSSLSGAAMTRDEIMDVLVFPITIGRTTAPMDVPSTTSTTTTLVSASISSGPTVIATGSKGNPTIGMATSSSRVLTTVNSAENKIKVTQGGSSFSTSSHASSHSSSIAGTAGQRQIYEHNS